MSDEEDGVDFTEEHLDAPLHRRKRDACLQRRPVVVAVVLLVGVFASIVVFGIKSTEVEPELTLNGADTASPSVGGPGGAGGGMPKSMHDFAPDSCRASMSCGQKRADAPCQCHASCEKLNNCCSDYMVTCNGYRPRDPALLQPSSAPTYTFYMYRNQNDDNYPPLNVNLASIGGVLWYLQNEVINTCLSGGTRGFAGESVQFGYRRWKISRILRYKVTYKAPEPLWKAGMSFGSRVAYDSGRNTGAWNPGLDMHRSYERYGYHVGCNILGRGPYPDCGSDSEGICPLRYPNPVWYSVPGPCPTQDIHHKSPKCMSREPGGFCKGGPTGQGNCTFTYEEAGDINIDDLSGITGRFASHYEFCKKGCLEWVKYGGGSDRGRCGITYWDRWHSKKNDQWRVDVLDSMFKRKYPDMPSDKELPSPPCDFNKDAFYRNLR